MFVTLWAPIFDFSINVNAYESVLRAYMRACIYVYGSVCGVTFIAHFIEHKFVQVYIAWLKFFLVGKRMKATLYIYNRKSNVSAPVCVLVSLSNFGVRDGAQCNNKAAATTTMAVVPAVTATVTVNQIATYKPNSQKSQPKFSVVQV